jgi:hypothetical protein
MAKNAKKPKAKKSIGPKRAARPRKKKAMTTAAPPASPPPPARPPLFGGYFGDKSDGQ